MTTTELEPDPAISAYKRDIDRTLLRQNLKRSVTERLVGLVALQRLAEEARQPRVTAEERSIAQLRAATNPEVSYSAHSISGLCMMSRTSASKHRQYPEDIR